MSTLAAYCPAGLARYIGFGAGDATSRSCEDADRALRRRAPVAKCTVYGRSKEGASARTVPPILEGATVTGVTERVIGSGVRSEPWCPQLVG
jgi:hypothetical protein